MFPLIGLFLTPVWHVRNRRAYFLRRHKMTGQFVFTRCIL